MRISYILQIGSVGQEVKRLQGALGLPPDQQDGDFGPKTQNAVKAFQLKNGLQPDGAAGLATLQALGIAPLPGIDTSHYQSDRGVIDWAAAKAAGVRFVWIKATQDDGSHDPSFPQNIAGARAAGIPCGAYHFAVPEKCDAKIEAGNILATIGKVGPLDLPAVLDLEANPGLLSAADLEAWALDWIAAVDAATGKQPVLYTSGSFIQYRLANAKQLAAAGVRLWVARYHGVDEVDPCGGGIGIGAFKSWTIWQYDQKGIVDGIKGACDRNWLAGGEAALQSLIGG